MYSTHTIQRAAATLIIGFLLALGLVASAQAGNAKPNGMSTQEWRAVVARSEAMDRYYHLGAYRTQPRDGNRQRAQAIDRYYHLGRYAVVRSGDGFVWADAGVGAGATLGAIIVAAGVLAALRRRSADRQSFPSAA